MVLEIGSRVWMDGYRDDGVPRTGTVEKIKKGVVTLKRLKQGKEAYRSYKVALAQGFRLVQEGKK